jgi:hypothetical protein
MDTGFPTSDAQNDFMRARRRRAVSGLTRRLRGEPSDVNVILPFEEVVAALGRVGESDLGLKVVPLDSIVGTVGRARDFDRSFRPISPKLRPRWERIANAQRRGESMPPVSLYRIGDLHFVRDGHHRVSVARALGRGEIDAYVTEVRTRVGANRAIRLDDLPLKDHERLFLERVPLPSEAVDEVRLSDPWRFAALAEGVEAWGFRYMQGRGELLDRREIAREWLEQEFRPVVEVLREAGLVGKSTDAEAYMRVARERFRLLRTHEWTDEIFERLQRELG